MMIMIMMLDVRGGGDRW